MRRLLILTAATVLALPGLAGAQDRPLMDQADAEELAQMLADATEEQGVCYGWHIQVQDDSGPHSGAEAGSSLDPNTPLDPAAGGCEKYVILRGDLHWTSDWSESYSSSTASIDSNLGDAAPTMQQIKDMTGYDGGSLSDESDREDEYVFAMASVLPLITAENGGAPGVPAEPAASVPAQDRATNPPGSDWMRNHKWKLGGAILLLLTGVGIALYGLGERSTYSGSRRNYY